VNEFEDEEEVVEVREGGSVIELIVYFIFIFFWRGGGEFTLIYVSSNCQKKRFQKVNKSLFVLAVTTYAFFFSFSG
jgi:hypothetical protein